MQMPAEVVVLGPGSWRREAFRLRLAAAARTGHDSGMIEQAGLIGQIVLMYCDRVGATHRLV